MLENRWLTENVIYTEILERYADFYYKLIFQFIRLVVNMSIDADF